MPLNPNGKIDKPALPFPDTAQVASLHVPSSIQTPRQLTPTERTIHGLWRQLLPSSPPSIALDENLADLGGHSIIATRLIFEIRKAFVVDAPLRMVFDYPTIGGQADFIDRIKQSDFGLVREEAPQASINPERPVTFTSDNYAQDLNTLLPELAKSFAPLPADFNSKKLTVLLTGATGFLGAFVLKDLLSRNDRVAKVMCLVRAVDDVQGLKRLREGCQNRAVWDETWVTQERVSVVVGDLGLRRFGLAHAAWSLLATEADIIVHNGAMVKSMSVSKSERH